MSRRKKPSGRKTKSGFGKPRRSGDLRRRPGTREPRKVIVIICEGEETEPNYFKDWKEYCRSPTVHVRVVPGRKEGTPSKLVEKAIEESKKIKKGDEVWCVCDVEGERDRPRFDKAMRSTRGIKVAASNPAFEYWYLLHFEPTDRPFCNAAEVIKALKKHLPDYLRNKKGMFARLKDRLETAIENAHLLRELSGDNWEDYPNPSTGVVDLVEELRKIKPAWKDHH